MKQWYVLFVSLYSYGKMYDFKALGSTLSTRLEPKDPTEAFKALLQSHCRNKWGFISAFRYDMKRLASLITRFKGPTWGPSGATGTRWAPCWPHALCYLGCLAYPDVMMDMNTQPPCNEYDSRACYRLAYYWCMNLGRTEFWGHKFRDTMLTLRTRDSSNTRYKHIFNT